MLRKIDCVMIRVPDVPAAAAFYEEVLGLSRLWRDGTTIGLGFPETDAEIVLHDDASIPAQVAVHYLVDDVIQATRLLRQRGCAVIVEPFDVPIGKCAVLADPFGTPLAILDMTKGPRPADER